MNSERDDTGVSRWLPELVVLLAAGQAVIRFVAPTRWTTVALALCSLIAAGYAAKVTRDVGY